MNYDPIPNCNCGLTGGCRLCNPYYGADKLDKQLKDRARNAPGIEKVWEITEKWPSLTKLLLEDRYS